MGAVEPDCEFRFATALAQLSRFRLMAGCTELSSMRCRSDAKSVFWRHVCFLHRVPGTWSDTVPTKPSSASVIVELLLFTLIPARSKPLLADFCTRTNARNTDRISTTPQDCRAPATLDIDERHSAQVPSSVMRTPALSHGARSPATRGVRIVSRNGSPHWQSLRAGSRQSTTAATLHASIRVGPTCELDHALRARRLQRRHAGRSLCRQVCTTRHRHAAHHSTTRNGARNDSAREPVSGPGVAEGRDKGNIST